MIDRYRAIKVAWEGLGMIVTRWFCGSVVLPSKQDACLPCINPRHISTSPKFTGIGLEIYLTIGAVRRRFFGVL